MELLTENEVNFIKTNEYNNYINYTKNYVNGLDLYLNCNENYNEKNYILQQIKNNKILLNEYSRIKVKLSKSLEKFKETNTHPQFDSFFDVNDRILITENIIDFLMDKQKIKWNKL